MKKLVFATNNLHKLEEINSLLSDTFQLLSLKEVNIFEDIEETSNTLEGNAIQKAKYVFERCGIACFADDTGLEVDSLNGAPGVYSARYAGEDATYADNVNKLLKEMQHIEARSARFRTVIAFFDGNKTRTFDGVIEGYIAEKATGANGFGYDPIFIPKGYEISFAEMSAELKNQISHRALAFQKFSEFISNEDTGRFPQP